MKHYTGICLFHKQNKKQQQVYFKGNNVNHFTFLTFGLIKLINNKKKSNQK
jgi:hypothetical protein